MSSQETLMLKFSSEETLNYWKMTCRVALTSCPSPLQSSLLMSPQPHLKKRITVVPMPTIASYRLVPTLPGKGRKRVNKMRVVLPNGVTMTQGPALPWLPGQVGFRGDCPVSLEDLQRAAEESQLPVIPMEGELVFNVADFILPLKHCVKCQRQWERWMTEIIPLVLPHYLEYQRKTWSLRDEAH